MSEPSTGATPDPEARRGEGAAIDLEASRENFQIVVFMLAERDFALRLADVVEILPMVALTAVPESSPWLPGVINLRGQTLPVIDLRKRLGLPTRDVDPSANIIIANPGKGEGVGLIVDRVLDVVSVTDTAFDPVGAMGGSEHPVRGVVRNLDRMIVVLDLDRVASGSPDLVLPEGFE